MKDNMIKKEFSSSWVRDLIRTKIAELGYVRAKGSYDVTFMRKDAKTEIDGIVCEVQDPLDPPKEELEIQECDAVRIIAKAKGIDLKKSKIRVSSYCTTSEKLAS